MQKLSLEERAKKAAKKELNWQEGDGTVRQYSLYFRPLYQKWLKKLSVKNK